jgi:hypothetical protein
MGLDSTNHRYNFIILVELDKICRLVSLVEYG